MLTLNTLIPIVIAIAAIGVIWYTIGVLLGLIKFKHYIVQIILVLVVWYFVGPLIYTWLQDKFITQTNTLLDIIYKPIHMLISLFK